MAIETSYAITAKVEESGVLARFDRSVASVSTWTKHVYQRLTIATGVTDQAVSLGGCAQADILFLTTNQPISIKLMGGSAIPVSSAMVLSAGVTSLTVSNSSGQTATVDILILD